MILKVSTATETLQVVAFLL